MILGQILLNILIVVLLITAIVLAIGALLQFSENVQNLIFRVGMALNFILVLALGSVFIQGHFRPIETARWVLFRSGDFKYIYSLLLDSVSFSFVLISTLFANIVGFFSHRYIHRESGFRRFFFIISFFIFGMFLAILGSNLDILFAGWEIVGISSYLLIAFYWERDKPVQNAQQVYLVYRFCDLGLLMGAFFAHTVLRESALFSELNGKPHFKELIQALPFLQQWCLALLIAMAALGKSAQFPFLTWLPKALEGPTPSTAIFYGALSIHLGVYLLIRLEPVWSVISGFPLFIGAIGVLSAILASSFGRLQSTVKGQIAYASSAQVGVMFLEVALGLHSLVMVHFVGNAVFRGYQLLSAPSIVVENLRLHSALGGVVYRSQSILEMIFRRRCSESLYLFCINEGYIDAGFRMLGRVFLKPMRPFRELLRFANRSFRKDLINGGLVVVLVLSVCLTYFSNESFAKPIAFIFIVVSLFSSYISYVEGIHPFKVVAAVFVSQFFPILTTALLDPEAIPALWFLFGSIFMSFCLALLSLYSISCDRDWKHVFESSGLVRVYPNTAALFFLSCVCMVGFPLGFSFIGEDLIFHYLVPQSFLIAFAVCMTYVLNGVTLIRLFGSLFLGSSEMTVSLPNLGFRSYVAFLLFLGFLAAQIIPLFAGR